MAADYLSAVISALSALLGAGIGGFATYRAAIRGSAIAIDSEQRVWTRERRENAYTAFLTARNRYVEAHVAKGDAMHLWALTHGTREQQDADPFDWEPHMHRTDEALAEVEHQLANLELFGSVAARHAAREWIPILRTNYGMATRPGGAFGAGVHAVQEEEVKSYRDPFISLIRDELGIPD